MRALDAAEHRARELGDEFGAANWPRHAERRAGAAHAPPHPSWFRLSLLGACLALSSCGGGGYETADARTHQPPRRKASPVHPRAGRPAAGQGLYPYAAPQLLTLDLRYRAPPSPALACIWWTRTPARSCQPATELPRRHGHAGHGEPGREQGRRLRARDQGAGHSGDGLLKGAAAKMRLRGSSTRLATLKSYRVKFDKGRTGRARTR
jgi:spore coat protein H